MTFGSFKIAHIEPQVNYPGFYKNKSVSKLIKIAGKLILLRFLKGLHLTIYALNYLFYVQLVSKQL